MGAYIYDYLAFFMKQKGQRVAACYYEIEIYWKWVTVDQHGVGDEFLNQIMWRLSRIGSAGCSILLIFIRFLCIGSGICRFCHFCLNYVRSLAPGVGDEVLLSASFILWFENQSGSRISLHIISNFDFMLWVDPRLGIYLVIIWEDLLHTL